MDDLFLFDPTPRTSEDNFRYSEPEFSYLNRSPRPEAGKVRRELERWFSRYPPEERTTVWKRFRSKNDVDHRSAFFELYLHELLLRLGCSVSVHPGLPNSKKRPDFLVETRGVKNYLEALVVSGESRQEAAARARMNIVYDVLDGRDSPNFFVGLNIRGTPNTPPRANVIRQFLHDKLSELDPDQIESLYAVRGFEALPRWVCEDATWVEFFPVPKRGNARGKGQHPLGMFTQGGWSTAKASIRKGVITKASRYGKPELPFVVALNVLERGIDEEETLDALFGTTQWNYRESTMEFLGSSRLTDGVWTSRSGPRYTRVSAVLIVRHASPWRVAHASASLYQNPWAEKPYKSALTQLPQVVVESGRANRVNGKEVTSLFRLPPSWPED